MKCDKVVICSCILLGKCSIPGGSHSILLPPGLRYCSTVFRNVFCYVSFNFDVKKDIWLLIKSSIHDTWASDDVFPNSSRILRLSEKKLILYVILDCCMRAGIWPGLKKWGA